MLKRTFTYLDYNDREITEDFYFNISESEVTEMEVSEEGGYVEMLQRIVNTQDGKMIMKTFKEFILKAYGEKSLDGKRFIKSEELSKAFSETPAYDMLFMEVCYDANKASAFVTAVLPKPKEEKMTVPDHVK